MILKGDIKKIIETDLTDDFFKASFCKNQTKIANTEQVSTEKEGG